MIEVDPGDPAFGRPSRPIGPLYDAAQAERLEREEGWVFMADGDVDAVYAGWGTAEQHAIRSATPDELGSAEFAAIGSIHDTQALLRGEAGTRVALDAAAVGS